MNTDSRFKSVCPDCLAVIEGSFIERNGALFSVKDCSKHGRFEKKISDDSARYFNLRNFFTSLIKPDYERNKKLLYVTEKCNMECPICCFRGEDGIISSPSLQEIENIAQNDKSELILFAMEPSCRKDIVDIIRMLKKNGKYVPLYTNGIKIADFEFLKKLKESGVDTIVMQFDGFHEDIYRNLRGGDLLLKTKLTALDNLRRVHLPVMLNDTVMKGVNDESMNQVLMYAIKNPYITGIMFIGYAAYGKTIFPEKTLEAEELIRLLERQTQGKILYTSVAVFQKLVYVYLHLIKSGTCVHVQNYWVYRKDGSYVALDQVIDMVKLDRFLDTYLESFYKKRRYCAGLVYLVLGIARSLKNYRLILAMFKDGLKIILGHLQSKAYHGDDENRFLQVNFSAACEPYRMDFEMLNFCSVDLAYKDKDGEVKCRHHCDVLLELWRKGHRDIMAM